jgi:hypothetical protein
MPNWTALASYGDEEQRDPDRLPNTSDPTGPCPRCDRVSAFTVVGIEAVTMAGGRWLEDPVGSEVPRSC